MDDCVVGQINVDMFYTQLILPMSLSLFITALLRPLGMPLMVSQIIAGHLVGKLFPYDPTRNLKTTELLDTYSSVGVMFYLFSIGVQVNPGMMLKGGKKGIVIGVSVVVLPILLVITSVTIIHAIFGPDWDLETYQDFLKIGIIESFSAFPVITSFLTELNMANMEFSQVATAASMISGTLSFVVLVGHLLYTTAAGLFGFDFIVSLVGCVLLLVISKFMLQPAIKWMINQVPEGHIVQDAYMCAVFAGVLILGAISSLFGLTHLLGPLIFGMIIPPGPPLGSALVERLEFFVTWTMMPVFYTSRGMMTDFTNVTMKQVVFTESIVLIVFVGKFLAAFLPALYYKMNYKNAILTGLAMNTQGFVETVVYRLLMTEELIPVELYTILVCTVVIVTGALVPLIRYFYKSLMKYKPPNLRTIQHLEPNTVLRVMACIYSEENVPSIMHFVKAINPTKDDPVNLSILHMVELVGHATPIIISHKMHKKQHSSTAVSKRIVNVFKQYEESDRRRISVNPYTVVSTYTTMHDYACVVALQQKSSFIILPYHRDLARGVTNKNVMTVNCKVLEKAPCSIGILIDRGLIGGTKSVLEKWSSHHVAVVFLGGADDREALALGERMSVHPTIELTVFRFLTTSDIAESEAVGKNLDDEMVGDFQMKTCYNNRVRYMEKEVSDGVEVFKVLESLADTYQMIIIGRQHDEKSPLILGFNEWEKSSEIGVIGDTFIKYGYGMNATILVVQQQTSVEPESPSFDLLLDKEEKQQQSQ